MSNKPLRYLRKEVRAEWARVRDADMDPLARAQAEDLLRFFDRRLDVAYSMEREEKR